MKAHFPLLRGAKPMLLLLLFAGSTLWLSCRRDPYVGGVPAAIIPPGWKGPTPYTYTDLPEGVIRSIKLDPANPLTKEGIALGRMLFYDPILSKDSTINCSSCHRQGLAFTDGRAQSLGVGSKVGHRNSMPLMNLVFYPKFFWDGRANSIEHQTLFPIEDHLEMNDSLIDIQAKLTRRKGYPTRFYMAFGDSSVSSSRVAMALGQFLRTLLSFKSPIDSANGQMAVYLISKYGSNSPQYRGFQVFNHSPDPTAATGECSHCHPVDHLALTTSLQFKNNALDRVFSDIGLAAVTKRTTDYGTFKVPSLRNIELTGPYMHDGRFKTLEEVVDHYSDHMVMSNTVDPFLKPFVQNGGFQLGPDDKKNLIAFLKMFTDRNFITNPAFASPF